MSITRSALLTLSKSTPPSQITSAVSPGTAPLDVERKQWLVAIGVSALVGIWITAGVFSPSPSNETRSIYKTLLRRCVGGIVCKLPALAMSTHVLDSPSAARRFFNEQEEQVGQTLPGILTQTVSTLEAAMICTDRVELPKRDRMVNVKKLPAGWGIEFLHQTSNGRQNSTCRRKKVEQELISALCVTSLLCSVVLMNILLQVCL